MDANSKDLADWRALRDTNDSGLLSKRAALRAMKPSQLRERLVSLYAHLKAETRLPPVGARPALWTPEEDQKLRDAFATPNTMQRRAELAAEATGRSVPGCEARASVLGLVGKRVTAPPAA